MLLNQKMHKNVIQLWINIPGIKIGENVVDVRRENLKLSTSARVLHTGGFHLTSLQLPPNLVDENKRSLISSLCSSASNSTLQQCYLCL